MKPPRSIAMLANRPAIGRKRMLGVLTVCAVAAPAFAAAPLRDDQPDVDIDSLKAEIRAVRGEDGRVEWHIDVKYEVEAEQPVPADLKLAFHITERGEVVCDPDGAPIELSIPLNKPAEVDDDEVDFKGRPTIVLPERSIAHPRDLKLHATAVGAGEKLDDKDAKIKFRMPR